MKLAVKFNLGSRRLSGAALGFTLIELILVMAMLLVVLSVAAPALSNFFRGRNLDSEARRLLGLTRYAQSRAVSEGIPMVLWFDVPARSYGLEAALGYLDVDARAVDYVVPETIEMELLMPLANSTVNFTQAATAQSRGPSIGFGPDGSVSESSPDAVLLLEGEDHVVALVRSENRLNYEVQLNPTGLRTR